MQKEVLTKDYKGKLEEREVISFVPEGISMWPIIKGGKCSVIVGKKQSRANEFDVIFYKRGEKNVLHRVIEVTEDGYVTMGDGLLFTEKVKKECVFGIMLGFYKGKRYISCDDLKYIKKVKKYYKRKTIRKIRIKIHYFFYRVKNKIKRIFKK